MCYDKGSSTNLFIVRRHLVLNSSDFVCSWASVIACQKVVSALVNGSHKSASFRKGSEHVLCPESDLENVIGVVEWRHW